MERTIGFDFGTHQTKICVEEKGETGTSYHFFPFLDAKGNESYILPSVVRINANSTLSYGFLTLGAGKVIRYFKQATYCTEDFKWENPIRAEYFSIWYIAYIIFHLETAYGVDFFTNMGVPTDTASLDKNKVRAVSIMLSAIHLVEDVFKNDLNAFLKCTVEELFEKTVIVPCSKQLKDSYSILVFPEAYACLRPLTVRRRIPLGMSLMVDIGGGTTDISFFTIENEKAQIYRFMSIAKGLNYLSGIDGDSGGNRAPSNITDATLNQDRKSQYEAAVRERIHSLISDLYDEYRIVAPGLPIDRLNAALYKRPIIFTGGGSTFPSLRIGYEKFSDVNQVSIDTWNITNFPDFLGSELCPILNTAYGLSISSGAISDDIPITPFDKIFTNLVGATTNPNPQPVINLRDGTVDTTGCDTQSPSTPIVWKVFHVSDGIQSICRQDSSDNIQRVRSSEINIANYFERKINPPAKPHKIEHSQEDVDEYLMLNFELYLPISDKLRDLYAEHIPDEKVKANFIYMCAELAKECELHEAQQQKDCETRAYFAKEKGVEPPHTGRTTPRQRIHRNEAPQCDFCIGNKVCFVDSVGGGIVTNIDKGQQLLEIEIESGFVISMPWSQCMKITSKQLREIYFPRTSKQDQPATPIVPQKTKEEKLKEKEEQAYNDGLKALMDKFNKK